MLLLIPFRVLGLDSGEKKERSVKAELPARGARIRCPRCAWVPRAHDRWQCKCDHLWNTFDTHGRCPACAYQWKDTCCPACYRWSPHDDWYAD